MKIIDGALRGRPGKFIVDYYNSTGKRRTPSFDTLKEAEEFVIAEMLFRASSTSNAINPNVTFAEYVPRCVQVWKGDELEEGTIEGHLQILNDHILPFFRNGKARIAEPDRDAVIAFKQHLEQKRPTGGKYKKQLKTKTNYSKNTIRNFLRTLSAVFTIAMEDGVRPTNPASRLGRRRGRKAAKEDRIQPIEVRRALTKAELTRVLVAARLLLDDRDYTAICLLVGTGMRPGEARAVQWKHFDLEGSQPHHEGVPMVSVVQTFKRGNKIGPTKGKEHRDVELEATLCALFRRLKERVQPRPDDFVFSEDGGRTAVSEKELNAVWPYVLAMANIDRWLPIYCLRHSYASILIREGAALNFVSRQLGHKDTSTTEQYYANWLLIKSHGALTKLGLATMIVLSPVASTHSTSGGSDLSH